jgi:hypothetical protein
MPSAKHEYSTGIEEWFALIQNLSRALNNKGCVKPLLVSNLTLSSMLPISYQKSKAVSGKTTFNNAVVVKEQIGNVNFNDYH